MVEPDAVVQRDLRIEAPVVLYVAAIVACEPLELPAVRGREPRGREPEQEARKFSAAAWCTALTGKEAGERSAPGPCRFGHGGDPPTATVGVVLGSLTSPSIG